MQSRDQHGGGCGPGEGARKEFVEVVRRLQRNAGGRLFYNLVEPYVRRCPNDGRVEDATAAIKECERTFKPEAGSILYTV